MAAIEDLRQSPSVEFHEKNMENRTKDSIESSKKKKSLFFGKKGDKRIDLIFRRGKEEGKMTIKRERSISHKTRSPSSPSLFSSSGGCSTSSSFNSASPRSIAFSVEHTPKENDMEQIHSTSAEMSPSHSMRSQYIFATISPRTGKQYKVGKEMEGTDKEAREKGSASDTHPAYRNKNRINASMRTKSFDNIFSSRRGIELSSKEAFSRYRNLIKGQSGQSESANGESIIVKQIESCLPSGGRKDEQVSCYSKIEQHAAGSNDAKHSNEYDKIEKLECTDANRLVSYHQEHTSKAHIQVENVHTESLQHAGDQNSQRTDSPISQKQSRLEAAFVDASSLSVISPLHGLHIATHSDSTFSVQISKHGDGSFILNLVSRL